MDAETIKNAKGEIFYGMHFYPGVAQYDRPGKPTRVVFLNENTIRKMDKTFSGCPLFVQHKKEIPENLDEMRKSVDGWVFKSFYNEADGKHWAEILICTDKGKEAIRNGWKLSNTYFGKDFAGGGQWNGVSYHEEITDGEYEHMAIVPDPRYEESVIYTPEQFKAYNEKQKRELERLSNSKNEKEGNKSMLKLFKRTKVENALDLEDTMVELPESKKEVSLKQAVDMADKFENMHGYANGDHMVKVGEDEMSVNDLLKAHMGVCNELAELKKPKDEDEDKKDNGKTEKPAAKAEEKKEEKKENALSPEDKLAAERAEAIRNAREAQAKLTPPVVEIMADQVKRGQERYGR